MELMQIRYFLEAAENEHMTMSAEKLHIAQPALTQSIRRFENELGVRLFKKQGRNIVLTEYGKYVRNKLYPLIKEIDALPEELKAMAHIEQNTVYINVLASSGLLTKAIIKYSEKHKDVHFKLMQNNTADSFDIQITTRLYNHQFKEQENTKYVYKERIFLAVPDNDRYLKKKSIELKEVQDEGFISLAGSRQFRYICDKFCHIAGIKPNNVFESDSPTAVQDMIASNMGVGFWPEHSWGRIANKNVKLLPISDPDCSREIIIDYNRATSSKYAENFYRFLIQMFENL